MSLIDSLIQNGWLKTPRIIKAFQKIKRVDFLPEDLKDLAELNEALPIGYGQTISQPLVVAFMLEQLQPKRGDKILDIGSGSGWTTAILAEIVSQNGRNQKSKISPPHLLKDIKRHQKKLNLLSLTQGQKVGGQENQKGRVIAIEIIPELMELGENNVSKYNFIEKEIVEFICGDGSKGYEKEAPFDGILVSASVQTVIPQAWKEQLKIGGRIVCPIGSSIWILIKKSEEKFEEIEYPGFAFVPLISKQ